MQEEYYTTNLENKNRTRKEDINKNWTVNYPRFSISKLTRMKKEVELSCQKDTIELQRPATNRIPTIIWCKKLNTMNKQAGH